MAVCPNCQVELAEGARSCPLCRSPLPETDPSSRPGAHYPDKAMDPEGFEGLEALSKDQKKKIFIEVFSICSLIVAFVVAAVDLFADQADPFRLSWSVLPVATLALAWLSVCVPLILDARSWIVFAVLGPALFAYVFLIDVLDGGGIGWFPRMGAPVVGLVEGAVLVTAILAATTKRKGLNVIAIALAAAAILVTGIDILINLHLKGRMLIGWSAVVDIAVVPVAGFLFYLHYRITRRASLRKLFHL